jgi:uncharacterized protein
MLLGLVFVALSVIGARAEPWPAYDNIFVNDFAGILDPEREANLTDRLTRLRDEHGIEMTVVTIRSINAYDPADSFEAFATRMFNGWGIGNAERNDGVMFLIAVEDRKMRLEVGAGYHEDWNGQAKSIIDNIMIPNFKKGEMGLGVEAGVGTMIARLTTNIAAGRAATDSPRDLVVIRGGSSTAPSSSGGFLDWLSGVGSWLWAVIVVPLLGGGAWLVRQYIRTRPRHCVNCKTKMVVLTETEDDEHLDEGSLLEESIKSVDYDVWECPSCAHVHIERWRNWFSRYGACRACKYRALESDSRVLRPATTSSSGLKEITYNCLHCGETWMETKTIPRRSKSSSSSSSSSFGGGRSSGGGASGSW